MKSVFAFKGIVKGEFNRECWLLLLGMSLDYRNNHSIQSAINSFGRMIAWENEANYLSRILLRARVIYLERVPQYITVTNTDGFRGYSWTVQCEVIEQHMLGGEPGDEDPFQMPNVGGAQQPPFNFFGFGQNGPGPVEEEEEEVAVQNNAEDLHDDQLWDLWPQENVQ